MPQKEFKDQPLPLSAAHFRRGLALLASLEPQVVQGIYSGIKMAPAQWAALYPGQTAEAAGLFTVSQLGDYLLPVMLSAGLPCEAMQGYALRLRQVRGLWRLETTARLAPARRLHPSAEAVLPWRLVQEHIKPVRPLPLLRKPAKAPTVHHVANGFPNAVVANPALPQQGHYQLVFTPPAQPSLGFAGKTPQEQQVVFHLWKLAHEAGFAGQHAEDLVSWCQTFEPAYLAKSLCADLLKNLSLLGWRYEIIGEELPMDSAGEEAEPTEGLALEEEENEANTAAWEKPALPLQPEPEILLPLDTSDKAYNDVDGTEAEDAELSQDPVLAGVSTEWSDDLPAQFSEENDHFVVAQMGEDVLPVLEQIMPSAMLNNPPSVEVDDEENDLLEVADQALWAASTEQDTEVLETMWPLQSDADQSPVFEVAETVLPQPLPEENIASHLPAPELLPNVVFTHMTDKAGEEDRAFVEPDFATFISPAIVPETDANQAGSLNANDERFSLEQATETSTHIEATVAETEAEIVVADQSEDAELLALMAAQDEAAAAIAHKDETAPPAPAMIINPPPPVTDEKGHRPKVRMLEVSPHGADTFYKDGKTQPEVSAIHKIMMLMARTVGVGNFMPRHYKMAHLNDYVLSDADLKVLLNNLRVLGYKYTLED